MAIDALRTSAAATAKSIARKFIGGAIATAGVGFLSAALWIKIAQTEGHAISALVLGLVYMVLGCIVLFAARRPTQAPEEAPQKAKDLPQRPSMEGVFIAFMKGLEAGAAARRGGGPGSR